MTRREWVVQGLAADGAVESAVVLASGGFEIGRQGKGLACPEDDQMADHHALLDCSETGVTIEDLGEGSGVWIRVQELDGRRLENDDRIWLGAQILVVRRDGQEWQLRHHGSDGRLRATHAIPRDGLFIGRVSDLVLDPTDGQLSRRHAQIAFLEGELRFFDRGAHNGSYMLLRAREPIGDGGEFRLATRRFRLQEQVLEADEPEAPDELGGLLEDTDSSAPAGPVVDALEEAALLVSPPEEFPPDAEPDALKGAPSGNSGESGLHPEVPARPRGLGARLRNLGRRISETGSIRSPESEPGTDAENAERRVTTERGEPKVDASVESQPVEEAATIVEPAVLQREAADSVVQGETPIEDLEADAPTRDAASERVLLVIDSAGGSVSLEVEPGKTVLEAVQEAGFERGEPVDWECGDGGCGVCVVGVLEGADRMDPPDPATGEMKTIQITEQVAPDPRKYRLACLARVRGSVRLRKLS